VRHTFANIANNDDAQSVSEYALLLAVILVVASGVTAALGVSVNKLLLKSANALAGRRHH
jgi:Flp pilus assembly pilin Flp